MFSAICVCTLVTYARRGGRRTGWISHDRSDAGNGAAALAALKQVLKIDPHTPQRPSIEKQIKQLQKQLAPPKKSGK